MSRTARAVFVDGEMIGYLPVTNAENVEYGNTNVKLALDGLSSEKVDKSGDTMSGYLGIDEQNGSAGVEGFSSVHIGNNKDYTQDKNSTGKLTLYSSTGKTCNIFPDAVTTDRSVWLPNASGTLALKSDINVLEDITSQCTVSSALVTSYGSFKVTKQGHLIQVFLGNAKFDHNGDLQGEIVTGLPQAVEQGNATPTGDGSSKTAAILSSGTAFWISKNATAMDGNIGSNTNNFWISLWYYCV